MLGVWLTVIFLAIGIIERGNVLHKIWIKWIENNQMLKFNLPINISPNLKIKIKSSKSNFQTKERENIKLNFFQIV